MPIGVDDEATGEILAAVVTTEEVHDGEILNDILDRIEPKIERVSADGAYDQCYCYNEIAEREARAVISLFLMLDKLVYSCIYKSLSLTQRTVAETMLKVLF